MSMPDEPGNCPIVATPFFEDGTIDHGSLENEIHVLAERGCAAVTLFGVASEFFKLSDAERDRMAQIVTDACHEAGLSPILSVTHESTVVAVERARQYEAAGADCVMVFPPRFLDPPAEAVVDHVRQIGQAVSVPVMVQHTGANVHVPPETFAALHEEVPNVRYFKIEVDQPGPYIESLLAATDGGVQALVGNWGYAMIDAYDRGARGVMPIAMRDELYVAIHDRYTGGDREGAVELHDELLAALNYVDTIPAAKRLLADQGIIETAHCRAPSGDVGDEIEEQHLAEARDRLDALVDEL